MCKPTSCSAATNFDELLFGAPVQATKDGVTKPPTAAKPKKEKKSKTDSKAKVQANGDKVLAERFRTKRCKNFLEKGSCPYESRCMFAHGDDQLRTTEMNLQDGLTTEEAIRQFKKMMGLKIRAQAAEARHRARVHAQELEAAKSESSCECIPRTPASSYGPSETASNSDDECSRVYVSETAYYYNPYGWNALDDSAVQCA